MIRTTSMTAAKVQILPLRKASPALGFDQGYPSLFFEEATKLRPKQTRTSKPKVRSGCVTCKIRKVKCDETKPACNRCTSTGRMCDGYAIKPRKKRATPTPRKALQLTTDISPDELRALDFFHKKTAPALSSYFDSGFWTRLVFQMSYVEPAIRHAMVALGALHEEREKGIKLVPFVQPVVTPIALENKNPLNNYTNSPNEQFALSQYGKAISHLSQRLNSETSIDVALLACILFVCVEFLRGDVEPALNHFRSGMGIAMSSLSNATNPAEETLKRIREDMLPFLNRVELLSTTLGNESPWIYPVELSDAIPYKFKNIREARDSLTHLNNLNTRFIRGMKGRRLGHRYDESKMASQLAYRMELVQQLDVWAETLNRMLLDGTFSDQELNATKTLRLHQIIAQMWLKRSMSPAETVNDETIADFETAVSLAEATQNDTKTANYRQASNSSSFLFDMEIVSPLYYIATKCRHPVIRRRAIAVLKQTQRREGLWDANMAAAIAERLMSHEEVELTSFDGSELPAERCRIRNTSIQSEIGTISKTHIVQFTTRPDGVDGIPVVWKERVVLP